MKIADRLKAIGVALPKSAFVDKPEPTPGARPLSRAERRRLMRAMERETRKRLPKRQAMRRAFKGVVSRPQARVAGKVAAATRGGAS